MLIKHRIEQVKKELIIAKKKVNALLEELEELEELKKAGMTILLKKIR